MSLFRGLPFLDFVGALHLVDIHADGVLDVSGGVAGVGREVFEHHPRPEPLLLQQLQRLAHQVALGGGRLKLVQVQTLESRSARSKGHGK